MVNLLKFEHKYFQKATSGFVCDVLSICVLHTHKILILCLVSHTGFFTPKITMILNKTHIQLVIYIKMYDRWKQVILYMPSLTQVKLFQNDK